MREGWRVTSLAELSMITLGGTPPTQVRAFWGGDVPWMASGDVHLRIIDDVPGRITQLGLQSSNATLVAPPAVAVALAGQGKTRGTVAFVRVGLSTNQSVALLKGADALDTKFLFHHLDRRYEELRARSSGGGRGGLSRRVLAAIPIDLPPLGEQRQIAAVLDTVDDAIGKTEQIIAKLKQVKQGLLRDLITRGVDGNGELRDPDRHPDEFKESPLGRIPRSWQVASARDICTLITKGTTPPASAFQTDERSVRYLRVDNLTFTGALDLSLPPLFIDRRTHELALARSRVREGDVLMNIVGPPLGKVSIVPRAQHDWNINQAIAIFRATELRVTPPFLATWLLSGAQTWFRREAKQTSGQSNLTLEMCGTVPVPLPSPAEQLEIMQRFDGLSARLSAESSVLSKLRVVKAGLMEDLLTGSVRVTGVLDASP